MQGGARSPSAPVLGEETDDSKNQAAHSRAPSAWAELSGWVPGMFGRALRRRAQPLRDLRDRLQGPLHKVRSGKARSAGLEFVSMFLRELVRYVCLYRDLLLARQEDTKVAVKAVLKFAAETGAGRRSPMPCRKPRWRTERWASSSQHRLCFTRQTSGLKAPWQRVLYVHIPWTCDS